MGAFEKTILMKRPQRLLKNFFTKALEKNIPLTGLLELTYACNLECKHCYIAKGDQRELSTKEWCSAIDMIAEAGCVYVVFTGGEIFTRTDCLELMEYTNKKQLLFSVFTNSTLITASIADAIKKLEPVRVEISLYGIGDLHDKITGSEGAYKRTIEAICLLKERQVPVFLKSVAMKHNANQVLLLKKLGKALGVSFRGVSTFITPKDNGDMGPIAYRLSDRQLKEFLTKTFQDDGEYCIQNRTIVTTKTQICNAARTSFAINPYGDVNPCHQIRTEGCSLKERSFQEVWNHADVFKQIRTLTRTSLKKCKRCSLYYHYCVPCIGLALLEKGDFTAPSSEDCRLAHITKEVFDSFAKEYSIERRNKDE